MLHRQPSSKDQARKSWGPIFGPAKVVKERVGGAEFVAFDCTSQEKAAHGHVVHAVQEVPFWAPFDAVFDTSCPGNERCVVELLITLAITTPTPTQPLPYSNLS
jgi:hypothetical protein